MKVVIFGATGVVGRAAAEHFSTLADYEVLAVSRRAVDIEGVTHVAVDLTDPIESSAILRSEAFAGTTHVVYAALQESPDLAAGWHDEALMAANLRMFRHALDPIASESAGSLQHVSLLQGGKAYGLHLGRTPLPAKEATPRDPHDNFYFHQEDALRSLADEAAWSWTILRPQVVYGESLASPMNLLPAISAYAEMERAQGRPLSFPGGERGIHEAVDARLLARALGWAATAHSARNETFNITNGDVFDWHDLWPAIAAMFAMEAGPPSTFPLAEVMPDRRAEWAEVVDRHRLSAPRDLDAFVGDSWQYADMAFGSLGPRRSVPALLSTIKIRQAGFGDCVDTEVMFRQWFDRYRACRLIPWH